MAALAAVFFPIAFIVPVQAIGNAAFILGSLTLVALPLAIAVAILRYRLFEIDRIVSRTLSYAIVTGLLGALFVGVILLLQTAFADALGGGGIPVAISTLAVFALFRPVLGRVRRSVDRRFDRARVRRGADRERVRRAAALGDGHGASHRGLTNDGRGRRRAEGSRDLAPRSGAMIQARVAAAIAITDMLLFAAAVIVGPQPDYGADALYLVGIGAYVGIGALLVRRVPANRIGVVMVATGTLAVAAAVLGTYADLGMLHVPPWPAAERARVIADAMFVYPILVALVGIPLIFPDGHLPSRRFRIDRRVAGSPAIAAWTLNSVFGTNLDLVVLVSIPICLRRGDHRGLPPLPSRRSDQRRSRSSG